MLSRLEESRRIALEAADALRRFGHTKDRLVDDRGAMCALGALFFAACGEGTPSLRSMLRRGSLEGARATQHGLEARLGKKLVDWNNAPERTAEEVIATLEAYALEAVS